MTLRTKRQMLSALTLTLVVAAHATPVLAQARLPGAVMDKLDLLSEEQVSFLRTDEPLRVILSREKLYQDIERRTPEQVAQYVSDMIDAVRSEERL